MKDPREVSIEDYNYILPEEKIARYPLNKRDESKLLVYENKTIHGDHFHDLTFYLDKDDLLVVNNTRVIHARMKFTRKSGASIEIFCLEPVYPADYQLAFQSKGCCTWKCIVGNFRKWKELQLERSFSIDGQALKLIATKKSDYTNVINIEFSWENTNLSFGEILEHCGIIPIPPYLHRETEPSDSITYQTVYSKIDGSVAAPTAGLHFTDELLDKLKRKGVLFSEVTLHVGAGTFQPMKGVTAGSHIMHQEHVYVTRENIESLLQAKGRIIAVGTTSLRTLESVYWMGCKLLINNNNDPFQIEQWETYQMPQDISLSAALNALLGFMDKNHSGFIEGITGIMIVPGYCFRVIKGLITNFHMPKSTLLLLIAALTGNDWKTIYKYAMENEYRFLSYGDSSLLIPPTNTL
jgi:S-adenosylmethionine:tRNA ribosyltransferase-isomerase